jgi:outer membrane beta-barrel protein
VKLLLNIGVVTVLGLGGVAGVSAQEAAAAPEQASAGGDKDVGREEKASSSAGSRLGKSLDDRIKSVQGKKFLKRLRFELLPWTGLTLNDAFYQYFHTGLNGTFHIFEGLAVEAGFSVAPLRIELPTVLLLRQNKSAVPEAARYFGNVYADLQVSPIYGKMSLFSEWVIHYDMFFKGGAGLAVDSSQWYVHPQVTVGMGQRVFLFDWLVLRADIQGSLYPQGRLLISAVQNHVVALLGVGFYIPPFFTSETGARRR